MLAPQWLLIPLVGLATAATVIASQATISGAYSMTLQASRLGYLPRVRILHTSDQERGQIYVPSVNWMMLLAVIALVLSFKLRLPWLLHDGIAVSGTMIIHHPADRLRHPHQPRPWRRTILVALGRVCLTGTGLLCLEPEQAGEGGWFPLTLGAGIFLMLTTWKRQQPGRRPTPSDRHSHERLRSQPPPGCAVCGGHSGLSDLRPPSSPARCSTI